MRRVLFTLFVLVMAVSIIQAQDFAKKGVIELGGSVSFSSTTDVSDGETADESTSTFTFSPGIGYFIFDGFELGLVPRFSSTSQGDYSLSDIAIFVVPEYHFNLNSNVYPYVGAAVGYNSMNIDNGTDDYTLSGLSYGALGGVKVQVGNAAIVDFGVEYFMFTYDPEDWDGDRNGWNQFAISAGVSIYIGR